MRKITPFYFCLSSSKEALVHLYQIRRKNKRKKNNLGEKLTFVLLTLGNKNSLELPFIFPLHFCQVTDQNKYPMKKIFYQSFEYFQDRNHLEVMCQGTLSVSSSPFLSLRMVLKKQKHLQVLFGA